MATSKDHDHETWTPRSSTLITWLLVPHVTTLWGWLCMLSGASQGHVSHHQVSTILLFIACSISDPATQCPGSQSILLKPHQKPPWCNKSYLLCVCRTSTMEATVRCAIRGNYAWTMCMVLLGHFTGWTEGNGSESKDSSGHASTPGLFWGNICLGKNLWSTYLHFSNSEPMVEAWSTWFCILYCWLHLGCNKNTLHSWLCQGLSEAGCSVPLCCWSSRWSWLKQKVPLMLLTGRCAALKFSPPGKLSNTSSSVFYKVSRHGQNAIDFCCCANKDSLLFSSQETICVHLKPHQDGLYCPHLLQHSALPRLHKPAQLILLTAF